MTVAPPLDCVTGDRCKNAFLETGKKKAYVQISQSLTFVRSLMLMAKGSVKERIALAVRSVWTETALLREMDGLATAKKQQLPSLLTPACLMTPVGT